MEAAHLDDRFTTLGLTAPWASVRHAVRVRCTPDAAWERIADVPNNASWFTSLVRSWVEPDPQTGRLVRNVLTPTGVTMVEDIVLVDHAQRRLQYRLRTNPVITHHLATIDVHDLTTDAANPECLVVYSTDLSPRPLALAFGSAAGRALETLLHQLEGR
jgi:hypothetical protein